MRALIGRIWTGSATGKIGICLTAFLILAAVLGPLLYPVDPNLIDTNDPFAGPSWPHPLGTDDLGRDVFARLLAGSRRSLGIAVGAVAFAATVGHVFGMTAGFLGGVPDLVIGRVTDIFFAIPSLLVAIGIIAVLGPSAVTTAIAIGIGMSPLFIRVVRSAVVQAKAQEFVTHDRALGVSWWRTIAHDVWPTILPSVLVQGTVMLGYAILDEAGLGFLGLGVQPPDASWGAMLTTGRRFMLHQPSLVLTVGATVAIAVFGLNLLSDALKDALDPRVLTRADRKKAR